MCYSFPLNVRHSCHLALILDLIHFAKSFGSLFCKAIFIFRKNPVTFPVNPVLVCPLFRLVGVPSSQWKSPRCPHICVSECVCGFREREQERERERDKEFEGGGRWTIKRCRIVWSFVPCPLSDCQSNKWFIDCAILSPSLLVFSPSVGGSNWSANCFMSSWPFLFFSRSEAQVACHLSHL